AYQSLDIEGRYLDANKGLCTLLGYSSDELLGKRFDDLWPSEARQFFPDGLSRFMQNGGEIKHLRLRRKDGKEIAVILNGRVQHDPRGNFLRAHCILTDITDQKLIEENLRRSKIFIDSVLENLPSMIFVKDAKDLHFLRFNKAGEELLGYRRDELLGKSAYDIFPKEEADFFIAKDREVLRSGRLLDIPEEPIQTKERGSRLLHTKKIPIYGADGTPQYLLGISEDITDRKQAEEALRRSEEQLRKVLEEREQLSQDLHDNIIQTIYAIGMGLEECRYLFQEDHQAADKKLEHAVVCLNRVISDVRMYIVWDKHEEVSGQQFCAKLAELAATMESVQGIRFSLHLAVDAARRLTPLGAFHILHIVQEAMSNSLRHSKSRSGFVSLQMEGGRIRLEVSDDGIGFNLEEASGQGHGLQNMAARAHKLGANFQIISTPGSGAQILVELPLEDQHARASS
ncbi:MAG: PAS domain S-box protein, partial [Nitrospiraceae bacterium]